MTDLTNHTLLEIISMQLSLLLMLVSVVVWKMK